MSPRNEFVEIPGFPWYMVNRAGVIFSKKKNRPLKQRLTKFGYLKVCLYRGGERVEMMAHRAVALTFLENPDNLPQINHKNENRTDNRVDNLEWCTPSYNINYGNRNKTVSEKLTRIKTETVGRKIMQISPETGDVVRVWDSTHQIERETGIPHSNIYACCTGRRKTRNGFLWKYAS